VRCSAPPRRRHRRQVAVRGVHPDSHGVIRGRLERLLNGEIVPPLEERIVRLDGTVTDVEVNTTLVEGSEGLAIQMTVRDIADRKRREAVLRESEERLMLAFAGAREGVWDWNVESGEVVYSPRWKEMLGYQGDEIFPMSMPGRNCRIPTIGRADALNNAVIRGESTYEGEFRLHREATTSPCSRGACRFGTPRVRSFASSGHISTSPSASGPRRTCAKARSG
jgi:PAS domain-containing protein